MSDIAREEVEKVFAAKGVVLPNRSDEEILAFDKALREGGEPLRVWFDALMAGFVSNAQAKQRAQGVVSAQVYVNEVGDILFQQALRKISKTEDHEWVRKRFEESVQAIGLRYEQRQTMEGKVIVGEKPGLILDKQPHKYEDFNLAVEIGGGKVQRRSNAD